MTSLSERGTHDETDVHSSPSLLGQEQSSLYKQQNESLSTISVIHTETSNESITISHQQDYQMLGGKSDHCVDTNVDSQQKALASEANQNGSMTDDTTIIITTEENGQQYEPTDITNNHGGYECRSKKFHYAKMKYPSVSPNRTTFYNNGHSYGPVPYYYLSSSGTADKPTPLMFIPTQTMSSRTQSASQVTSSSPSSSSRENHAGNSVAVASQNLPPRLRQVSSEDSEAAQENGITLTETAASTNSQTLSAPVHGNTRRQRSILPRSYANYYAQHPPPPLMATPPGVLYPYPPTVHPTGAVAYNIRSAEDLEYYTFATQYLGMPPAPFLWPSPSQAHLLGAAYPPIAGYPIGELPSSYMLENANMIPLVASPLNPDAAEWIPQSNEGGGETVENQILLDDDINFPPLNSTTHVVPSVTVITKDSPEDNAEITTTLIDTNITTVNIDEPLLEETSNVATKTNPKLEPTLSSASSQDDTTTNKSSMSSSLAKVTPISYSTVIIQTSDNQKSTKTTSTQNSTQRRHPTTNHQSAQPPTKDRPTKTSSQQPQRGFNTSQNTNSRRRQSAKNKSTASGTLPGSETDSIFKQQQQSSSSTVTDEWIEVRSKKMKKFDRLPSEPLSAKSMSDEVVYSPSPPLPPSSTGENTTASLTSEDDLDDKDHVDLGVIIDNDIANDYNQDIIDEIRAKLNRQERVLIIMRGCPGSGKSTLARCINNGYNGVILSTDDYFTDKQTNQYVFDSSNLDEAHRYNHRRASDAFKRNVSPLIIDNTNTQTWEMKPYIAMGQEAGYDIVLVEPQTPWRYKARELSKRNRHSLPLKRIKEILNRFEHNVNVQTIIDQLPNGAKTNICSSISEQIQLPEDNEIIDRLPSSKKLYDIVDDSLILDEVRLCINDMILFLTSQFYQTALSSYTSILTNTTTTTTTSSQPSTPLSVSFHDLSLLSSTPTSLPSTPTTPHTRFHRPLVRFPSTTTQDYSYNTDHLLRFPSTITRCFDSMNSNHFTSSLPTQSSILGKKRRKNKNKSSRSEHCENEILINTNNNNNNNNMNDREETNSLASTTTFKVYLAEECSDIVVFDEQQEANWLDEVHQNYGSQMNRVEKQSSIVESNTSKLLNILDHQLNQPAICGKTNSALLLKHIVTQCSSEDFNSPPNHSDRIIVGRQSLTPSIGNSSIYLESSFNHCGIQVDLDESNIGSSNNLMEYCSNRLSADTVQQVFETCHGNIQWSRTPKDEFVGNRIVVVPTLRQLTLNTLNQWNEQIKSIHPTFDTNCLNDLLQDINDEGISGEFIENNSIQLPWSTVNSFEELYGDLSNRSFSSLNQTGITLPVNDDDLSINMCRVLERYVMKSSLKDSSIKPVTENQRNNSDKNKINYSMTNRNQRWILSSESQSSTNVHSTNVPSLKQIVEERQVAMSTKSKPKNRLDYASEYKLRDLERQYPCLDSDLIYDLFQENEYNYEMTLGCILSLLNQNSSINIKSQVQSNLSLSSKLVTKVQREFVVDLHDVLRSDALDHSQRRKEYYIKAHQASRHGFTGVASFCIHQAREETRLMKNANRAACERLSCWRLTQFYQMQKLDLRGLHSDEVLQLFKRIEQELNKENRHTTEKSIEILIDYGKNCSAILNYIQQKRYKYSEPNRGVILLQFINTENC